MVLQGEIAGMTSPSKAEWFDLHAAYADKGATVFVLWQRNASSGSRAAGA